MNFYDTRYVLWMQSTTATVTITSKNANELVIQQVARQTWGQVGDQIKQSIFNEEKARLKKKTSK